MAQPSLDLDDGQPGSLAPPYISFSTLQNCLDWLAAEGVPLRFDRTAWERKYSGSVGPQLMAALRFLGLLKGDEPVPELEPLAKATGEERKKKLLAILKRSYTTVTFEQLHGATPGMLRGWFAAYNLKPNTERKVTSFFINALKYAGHPLSSHLIRIARNKPSSRNGTAAPKAKKAPRGPGTDDVPPQPPRGRTPQDQSPPPSANVRTVALASGGKVTVAIETGDVFAYEASQSDGRFVHELVGLILKYEAERTAGSAENPAKGGDA